MDKITVVFLCVDGGLGMWGKTGSKVKMVFDLPVTLKTIENTKPGGWVIESFELYKETL